MNTIHMPLETLSDLLQLSKHGLKVEGVVSADDGSLIISVSGGEGFGRLGLRYGIGQSLTLDEVIKL